MCSQTLPSDTFLCRAAIKGLINVMGAPGIGCLENIGFLFFHTYGFTDDI